MIRPPESDPPAKPRLARDRNPRLPAGRFVLTLPLAFALAATACKPREAAPPADVPGAGAPGRPIVFTTFYPTEYFTERIAGDLVDVRNPVPEGEDPIFWIPEDAAVTAYQSADLIVLNGAGFAKWVDKVSLPEDRVVDTAAPFEDEFIRYENAVTHSHGAGGAHSHEGLDGHTWLDPVNAIRQAEEIRKALARLLPSESERLDAAAEALRLELEALDRRFQEVAERLGDRPLLASHPAYNYPARRYGWHLENLDLDPGEMPDDSAIASIRDLLAKHPANLLLWEGDPLPGIARRLRDELGLESVVFSPCELLDEESRARGEDLLTVMRANLDRLDAALTAVPATTAPPAADTAPDTL